MKRVMRNVRKATATNMHGSKCSYCVVLDCGHERTVSQVGTGSKACAPKKAQCFICSDVAERKRLANVLPEEKTK